MSAVAAFLRRFGQKMRRLLAFERWSQQTIGRWHFGLWVNAGNQRQVRLCPLILSERQNVSTKSWITAAGIHSITRKSSDSCFGWWNNHFSRVWSNTFARRLHFLWRRPTVDPSSFPLEHTDSTAAVTSTSCEPGVIHNAWRGGRAHGGSTVILTGKKKWSHMKNRVLVVEESRMLGGRKTI